MAFQFNSGSRAPGGSRRQQPVRAVAIDLPVPAEPPLPRFPLSHRERVGVRGCIYMVYWWRPGAMTDCPNHFSWWLLCVELAE